VYLSSSVVSHVQYSIWLVVAYRETSLFARGAAMAFKDGVGSRGSGATAATSSSRVDLSVVDCTLYGSLVNVAWHCIGH
jgi:hypothetical protein